MGGACMLTSVSLYGIVHSLELNSITLHQQTHPKLNSSLQPFERYDPCLIPFEIFSTLPQRFAHTICSIDIGRIGWP